MQQTEQIPPDAQSQAPAGPRSPKEQRAATKLAKQQAKAAQRQARHDQRAANAEYDETRTDPDSFYERAIEWTHRADKIINLFLGYALAIASVLGFMDVLSNGEVLGSLPWAFYAWLLIMGLGVDFQILLVIGRVPDLARMVGHPVGKRVLVIFNILFLAFLAYVSIIIGAVFTQHRDVLHSTISQSMALLGINSTSFVYERAALATFLLILMAVDRTMERWRMQIAASKRQHQRGKQQAQESEREEQQQPPAQPIQASDLAQIITAMQEMNAQNLAAMQAMSNETINRFSTVTVELVRETIERTAATVALGSPTPSALPLGPADSQSEQQDVQGAAQGEQETMISNLEEPERCEQETPDYGALIEGLYKGNRELTVTDIVDQLGCSRSTAQKWLKRVKPVTA